MPGFIEELYYGNIDPQARSFESDSQYGKAMAIISKTEELLTNQLKDEEKRLFLEYTNAWGEVLGITGEESFSDGFRIGAQFTYDAFVGTSSQFKDYLKD